MLPFRRLRLLVCFFSVPVWAARVEVTAAAKGVEPAWDEGLGCYCKKVKSDSDCTDRAGSDEKPDRLRWFHDASDGQDPLCCKLAWTSMLSWVGMGYGRQPTPGLCQEETRPVPSEACCRLPDSGDRGLYVSKVTMVLRVNVTSATKRTFRKSTPEFQIADIHAGRDYDGSRVDGLSDVHTFALKWFGKVKAKCSGPWDRLVQDTARSCLLRHTSEQDCCCEEAAVKEEERCLPTGVTGLSAEPCVLRGNYTIYNTQIRLYGPVWPQGEITFSSVSPEAKEDILPSSLSSQGFTWNKGTQWQWKCDQKEQVPKIGYRVMETKWRDKDTVPFQKLETECLVYSFIRHCPADQGLYVKQPNQGECFQEPGLAGEKSRELTRFAGLSFKCPEGYRSGTEFNTNYSPRCNCSTKCA